MTKDKTVTMSRELAQKVDDILYIMTGNDSYQRLVQKLGTGWCGAIDEIRGELCSAIAAKPQSYPCWSCKAPVTMANRADADGNCPYCEAELDLEDWPLAAPIVEADGMGEAMACQPDAYMTVLPSGIRALFFPSKNIDVGPYDKPLFASQPAPVSDDRQQLIKLLNHFASCADIRQVGTAAIDKVKELNQ